MRSRVLVGAGTAAVVAALLGAGQPLLLAWTGTVSWEHATSCRSTDRGDNWWHIDGWFVWWLTGAMVMGVLAGLKAAEWAGRRDPEPPHRARRDITVIALIALAATVAASVALWRALAHLFGSPGDACADLSSSPSGVVVAALAIGLIAIAVAGALPETRFAFVAGWVWVWVINVNTWITGLLGRPLFTSPGEVVGPQTDRDFERLHELIFYAGYLLVLPALVYWRAWRRTGSFVRAVPSVLVVHCLMVAANIVAESTRFD